MEQSLWRDDNIGEESMTNSTSLKLQFPLSISPDVCSFTALRTIYALHEVNAVELDLHSSTLAMDFHSALHRNWDIRQRRDSSGGSNMDAASSSDNRFTSDLFYEYLYWTHFSPDGRFLFFVDNEFGEPSTIAVFEIQKANGLCVSLVDSQNTHVDGFDERLCGITPSFYPSKFLVSFPIGDMVFLWAFGNGKANTSAYNKE